MVFIWDNGGEYSNHQIQYVELDETIMTREELETFLGDDIYSPDSCSGFIIGWASEVEWTSGSNPFKTHEFIGPGYFVQTPYYGHMTYRMKSGTWKKHEKLIRTLYPLWVSDATGNHRDNFHFNECIKKIEAKL